VSIRILAEVNNPTPLSPFNNWFSQFTILFLMPIPSRPESPSDPEANMNGTGTRRKGRAGHDFKILGPFHLN